MSWHYRIGKYTFKGETYYGLFEYITEDGGKKISWTWDPVALPYAETVEEVLHDLENMLKDAKHYDVFNADDEPNRT